MSIRKFIRKLLENKKTEQLTPEIKTYLQREEPYGGTGEEFATREEEPIPWDIEWDWEDPPMCDMCGKEASPIFDLWDGERLHHFCSDECADEWIEERLSATMKEDITRLRIGKILSVIQKMLVPTVCESVKSNCLIDGYKQEIESKNDKQRYEITIKPIKR